MKTRKLLKLFTTIVAVMLVSATFAQENAPWDDMTGRQDDAADDSVVVNMALPYYVEPDPVLNDLTSQYDPTLSNAAQDINSTFNWTSTGDVSFTAPSGDANAPYREVTFNTAADDVPVDVQEINQEGCAGTTTTELVDVINEPGFTLGSQDQTVCDGAISTIDIESISGDAIDGTSMYYFVLDIDKRLYEADGTTELIDGSSPVYTRADTVAMVKTTDVSGGITIIPNYTFTCGTDNNGDLAVTKYTFDFTSNLGGDDIAGLNHHISRKGDFLSLADDGTGKSKPDLSNAAYNGTDGYPDGEDRYTWFGADAGTITVTVYPAPSTGHIYHVPNTFEQ